MTKVALWLQTLLIICARAAHADAGLPRTLIHQGIERRYVVHVPGGVPGPRLLLIALHALTRQPWSLFDAIAVREGFVLAYPQALEGRWSYWRGGGVMLPGRDEEVDDAGFIVAVVDQLVAEGVADPGRVFVTGSSRGALMTWTLACQNPARFAAAAPLLCGMTAAQLAACAPAGALPIVAVAGTADPVQPYDGETVPGSPRLLSIPKTMEFWRRQHGCTSQIMRELAHRDPLDPTRTEVVEWTGCSTGGLVMLYRVVGGGHLPPGYAPETEQQRPNFGRRGRDFETAEELWQVFRSIRL